MIRVAIIIGSTRPGRKAEAVAHWVYGIAKNRGEAEFELVDILDFNPQHEAAVNTMLDKVIAWGGALKSLREAAVAK